MMNYNETQMAQAHDNKTTDELGSRIYKTRPPTGKEMTRRNDRKHEDHAGSSILHIPPTHPKKLQR
jgi:hypothetical protein